MKIVLALLTSVYSFAAVDGVVLNGTTGKPQPSVLISLVQPQQSGMQTIATVKSDEQGKFKIDKDYPPGPALLQSIYEGVVYTQMIPPGSPTSGISVKIFDSTKNTDLAKTAQHLILLEPTDSGIQVSETFLFNNQNALTYSDPAKGSAEFYVPKDGQNKIQVIVNTSGGMPVPRDAEKTKQADVYKIDYPVKPGETRFDIAYALPPGDTFAGKNVSGDETFLVTPPTVTLTGEGIDDLGQEPQSQAHTYRLRAASFNVKINGTGSLRNNSSANSADDDSGQPQIEQAPARVYTKLPWVLGLTLGILMLGGTMLFRKGTA